MPNYVRNISIVGAVVVAFPVMLFADANLSAVSTNSAPAKKIAEMSREELLQHRQASAMRRFGGYVRKDGSASGKVVFLNAQRRLPAVSLRRACEYIDEHIHPIWELKDVASVKVANPSSDIRAAGGEIGIAIVDDEDLPALVVAPEVGWAVVNVGALTPYAENDENLASRVRKEILRAFALVGGAAFMTLDPIVMRPDIRKPQEVDLIGREEYGIDVVTAIERGLPLAGVKPWRVESYKKACQEGWAHSPTNEFQQKVWDKVHALPTNPLPLVKPGK